MAFITWDLCMDPCFNLASKVPQGSAVPYKHNNDVAVDLYERESGSTTDYYLKECGELLMC